MVQEIGEHQKETPFEDLNAGSAFLGRSLLMLENFSLNATEYNLAVRI